MDIKFWSENLRQVGRPVLRWEHDIRMYLREFGFIWLGIGTGGLL
jgi:hypothetical protein